MPGVPAAASAAEGGGNGRYGRKCGDNKGSGILAQYIVTGFFLDDICCTFNRGNNTLRVEVDILQFADQ